ncbi:MAG TPA: hypothetical protein VN706_17600 [Gemmatimonadaceae bacterium]|nr:hypothetical protein [Gemmatimonadaceae bacterium]
MSTLLKMATLLATAGGLLTAQTARGTIAVPNVTFDYSPIDQSFFALAKLPPDSARIAATMRHLPAWRDSWSRQGPELFRATVIITHSAFKFSEAKAALISCPGYPSTSFPLMINVRLLFDSAGVPVARDTARFASYLFHETLHRYISDIIESRPDSTTPLLRKYAREHPPVLAHLHLYALMDTVYRQLRRGNNVLQPTGPTAPTAGGVLGVNDLDRAREIVRAEGVAAFVRELQPTGKTSPND